MTMEIKKICDKDDFYRMVCDKTQQTCVMFYTAISDSKFVREVESLAEEFSTITFALFYHTKDVDLYSYPKIRESEVPTFLLTDCHGIELGRCTSNDMKRVRGFIQTYCPLKK
jgi:hypothetical protein